MPTNPSQHTLVAVDTNVLLDCACGEESPLDALATIRRKIKLVQMVVSPTVLEELGYWARFAEQRDKQKAAQTALRSLRTKWNFRPVNLIPVGHGIVEQIALRLQRVGLLPTTEYHDALILSEAALLGCSILLTGDAHLRELDFRRASLELKACDVEMPVVATPREIAAKFF